MVLFLVNFSSKEKFLIIIKLSTKVILLLLEQVLVFKFERDPTLSNLILFNLNVTPHFQIVFY